MFRLKTSFFFAIYFLFIFTCDIPFGHCSSSVVDKYINNAERHFDSNVGKFVDYTNKQIIGVSVDSNTRKVQIAAVKLMLDPRTEKVDIYLKDIESGVTAIFQESGKSNTSYNTKKPKDPCASYYDELRTLIKRYNSSNNVKDRMETRFRIDVIPIDIMQCYIEKKEYNLGLDWAKYCEREGWVSNMSMANIKRFWHWRDKLEMVVKGADNW